MRLILYVLLTCAVILPVDTVLAAENTTVAVISGVHPPHQGFAISVLAKNSDRCLQLGQDLAAELGVAVQVMCVSNTSGTIEATAICGFTDAEDSDIVGNYHHDAWRLPETAFLKCVPVDNNGRYDAKRIAPDLGSLKPIERRQTSEP